MTDLRETWLMEVADRLRKDIPTYQALDVEGLATELKVPIVKSFTGEVRRSLGYVEKHSNGELRISLHRATPQERPLTIRERFTIAHEIGHVLIIRRFDWSPTARQEYFQCEKLCNSFAGAVLIPAEPIRRLRIRSSIQVMTVIEKFARIYQVSLEVMAHRFTELRLSAGFIRGNLTVNKKGKRVFKVIWGQFSNDMTKIYAQTHLFPTDPLGLFLFSFHSSDPEGLKQTVAGDLEICGKRMSDGAILATILKRPK